MEPTEGNLNEPLYRDPRPSSWPSKNTKRAVLIALGSFLLLLVCDRVLDTRSPRSPSGRAIYPVDLAECAGVSPLTVGTSMGYARVGLVRGLSREQTIKRYGFDESDPCQMAVLDYEWTLVIPPSLHPVCDDVPPAQLHISMIWAKTAHYSGLTRAQTIMQHDFYGLDEDSACDMAVLDYEWSLWRRGQ